MADWREWLDRGKSWMSSQAKPYTDTEAQAQGMGNELASKMRMVDEARQSLGKPSAFGSATPAVFATHLAPVDQVNPGYRPIGGENALQSLYAGRPPELLPPPSTKRKFAHATK